MGTGVAALDKANSAAADGFPAYPIFPNVASPRPVSARMIDDYSPAQLGFGQIPPPPENQAGLPHREFLYMWYDRMPEIRGSIAGMVDDIFGEGYMFQGSDARVKKVKQFCKRNRFNAKAHAVARDWIVTGDGYLGKASITPDQVAQKIKTVHQNTMAKAATIEDVAYYEQIAKQADPDLYSPRVLFPIKSRSLRIDYDSHGEVFGYVQQIRNANTVIVDGQNGVNDNGTAISPFSSAGTAPGLVRFEADEVIHFAYEPVGDDIYGTSPLLPAIWDICSLWYAKNYGGKFFENDATPSRIWKLPDEVPGSINYNNFVSELKKHQRSPNRNLVTTGNIESEPVTTSNKDMAFSDFIDRYLKHVLMSTGQTFKYYHMFGKGQQNNELLEPYYKKINLLQQELEEQYNAELFEYFDVEIDFNRVYKRDESREADIVQKLVGRPVMTVNEGREYLGYRKTNNPADDEVPEQAPPAAGKAPMSDVAAVDARREQNSENQSSKGKTKKY